MRAAHAPGALRRRRDGGQARVGAGQAVWLMLLTCTRERRATAGARPPVAGGLAGGPG